MFIVLVTLAVGLLMAQEDRHENMILNAEQVKLRDEINRLDKSVTRSDVYATCGWVLFKEYVDYFTAVKKCKDNEYIGINTPGGRQLVSIHSENENNIVKYMMLHGYGSEREDTRYTGPSNWAWIGLRKINNTDNRITAEKVVWDKDDWVWEDGSSLDDRSYTNWMQKNSAPVQPDMKKDGDLGHQTAARLFRPRAGVWDDTYTNMLHPYICKFNVPLHYVVYDEPMTWDKAKATCEARGLYFAKIRSSYENAEFVKAVQRVWGTDIHDKKFHHQNWIWIGASDERESGHFEFYDQEQIRFKVPWAKKQHDNKTRRRKGSQDHVAVARWGEWDDSYGDHWDRPFACQCHAGPMPPSADWVEPVDLEKEKQEKKKKEKQEKMKEKQDKKKEMQEKKKKEKQEKKKEKQDKKKEMQEKKKKEKQEKKKEKQDKKKEMQEKKKKEKEDKKKERQAKKKERQEKKKERQEKKGKKGQEVREPRRVRGVRDVGGVRGVRDVKSKGTRGG